ncbi:MAG: rhodanese-like domain-containing protein [Pseudomonadales bacterium]
MNWNSLKHVMLAVLAMCLSTITLADTVWIDVRSAAEHTLDNIEGDIRISYDEIAEKASKQFPDKDTDIRLYCHSGLRSENARRALQEAGYTNVKNVGGIDEARKERGISE